jgi:hypothetical protein
LEKEGENGTFLTADERGWGEDGDRQDACPTMVRPPSPASAGFGATSERGFLQEETVYKNS